MIPAAKTIYFTRDMVPTQEDYAAAEAIGPGVVFRNAMKIVPGAPLENCDAVAGAVPPDYAAVFSAKTGDEKLFKRPNPVKVAHGGPDDLRPGTIDTGVKHESGTGSSFSGDPYAEKQPTVIDQRAGRTVYDKNPEREQPAGSSWPTQQDAEAAKQTKAEQKAAAAEAKKDK